MPPSIGLGDYTVQAKRETAEALFGAAPGDGPYVTLGLFRAGLLADPKAAAEASCGDLNLMIERLAGHLERCWVWSGAEIVRERRERTGSDGLVLGPS